MSLSISRVGFSVPMQQSNVQFKANPINKKVVTEVIKVATPFIAGAVSAVAAGTVFSNSGKFDQTTPELTTEEAKARIKGYQNTLQELYNNPPQTKTTLAWTHYRKDIEMLEARIAALREIAPLDKTNLEEVLAAKPEELFNPQQADNIKGQGITFLQSVPQDEAALAKVTYEVVPLPKANSVKEFIAKAKEEGVNIELVQNANSEYYLGVKNIWNKGEYFRIDRDGAVIKYGKMDANDEWVDQEWAAKNADSEGKIMDCAVIANSSDCQILSKSYVKKDGSKITEIDMLNRRPFFAHKDGNAVTNAVAWDEAKTINTLEGPITVDATMGDVEGFAYNDFKQLVKQVKNNKKLCPNPADPNSVKFCELVNADKLDEAKALLIKATQNS